MVPSLSRDDVEEVAEERRLRPTTIVVVGGSPQLNAGALLNGRSLDVYECDPESRAVRSAILRRMPDWLLLGEGIEERRAVNLVQVARAACPGIPLAVLGDPADWRRCERWKRRDCAVYLATTSDLSRLVASMRLAAQADVQVVDRTFIRRMREELAGPTASLTTREEQVLDRMCHGLRNVEIAASLHVSEATIEFHVHNILSKLSVTSRTEAVRMALYYGLV